MEVLGLVAEGLSNNGIGERLVLSPRTVEVHVAQLLTKLGLYEEPSVNRRVLAVLTHLRTHAGVGQRLGLRGYLSIGSGAPDRTPLTRSHRARPSSAMKPTAHDG